MTGDVRTIVKMTVHGMLPGCFIGNWATNSREEMVFGAPDTEHKQLFLCSKYSFQLIKTQTRADPNFRMLLLLLLPTVLCQGVTTPASPTFPFEDIEDPNAQ